MPKEDFVEKNPYIVYASEPESEGGSGGGGDAPVKLVNFVYASGNYTCDTAFSDILDALNSGKRLSAYIFNNNSTVSMEPVIIHDNNDPDEPVINVYFYIFNMGTFNIGPLAYIGEQWVIDE